MFIMIETAIRANGDKGDNGLVHTDDGCVYESVHAWLQPNYSYEYGHICVCILACMYAYMKSGVNTHHYMLAYTCELV